MRYPCLVVDHDDTVVDSTATVHYPCFVEYTGIYHPEVHYTLDEYIKDNFDPGIVALFRDIIGMSEEEMEREQRYWNDYVKRHVPRAYDGMRELLWRHKRSAAHCASSRTRTRKTSCATTAKTACPSLTWCSAGKAPRTSASPVPIRLRRSCAAAAFRGRSC